LTDQIKIAEKKISELEDEKKYLEKMKGEHDKCEEKKQKIRAEIKITLNEFRK